MDGYIVIGYEDKTKTFHDCKFDDSGLKDTSQLFDLVNKGIAEPFDFSYVELEVNGHKIGIVHIPPSLNKPHVIRNYQTFHKDGSIKSETAQRIFVRKNTGTYAATKYDIDLMYYDRKNIIPEYELYVWYHLPYLSLNCEFGQTIGGVRSVAQIVGRLGMTFENGGRRSISLDSFTFILALFPDASDGEKFKIEYSNTYPGIKGHVLKSQDMLHQEVSLVSYDHSGKSYDNVHPIVYGFNHNRKTLFVQEFTVYTTNGLRLYPKLVNELK